MKILVTGGRGFVGRNLVKTLKQEHEVFSPTSKELDLTDSDTVEKYLRNKYFDWVIHCAISGGTRVDKDSPYTTYNNLKMFFNLMNNKDRFGKFINFASGAEFDRTTNIDTNTNDLLSSYPTDYYGMAKNIISRILKDCLHCYNFRIYGVFGVDENEERFIKTSINKVKEGKPIEIHQDKHFDFIYIDDLIRVVKYYIDNPTYALDNEIDLVYQNKYKLSDIAKFIPGNNKIELKSEGKAKSYIGALGMNLDIELVGLEEGIKRVYNAL